MPKRLVWPLIALAAIAAIAATVLVLAPSPGPPELRENTWKLIRYRDESGRERTVMPRSTATVTFDRATISGFGGVNEFEADYSADADSGSIEIDGISATGTEGFGADMREEAAFLGALEDAAAYEIADGQLSILDGDGQRILAFTPLAEEESAEK